MATKSNSLQSDHSTFDSLTPTSELPVFRTAYSPRVRVAVEFRGVSLTKQSFKDECDINNLMSRYRDTGILDHVNQVPPRYIDVSEMDYQQAMDTIAGARSLFHALPSEIRDRFGNDPQRLLEFVDDPRNMAEAVELGFLDKARVEALRKAGEVSEPKATRGDEGEPAPKAADTPPGKAAAKPPAKDSSIS